MLNKQHASALVAEFFGTGVLALTILSMVNSQIPFYFFVALAAGLVLMLLVGAFGNVSGANFNPAVTIGLWTIRKTTTVRAITYIAAQMLGAYAAFALFNYLHGQDSFTWINQAKEFNAQVLVAEVVGTAVFCFGIAAALLNNLPTAGKATIIGVALTVGIIIAGTVAPGFLNPAIAFASQAWDWWMYLAGPILGAVIGFNLYTLIYSASLPSQKSKKAVVVAPEATEKTEVKNTDSKKVETKKAEVKATKAAVKSTKAKKTVAKKK